MANYKIEKIERISAITGDKLRSAGVINTIKILKSAKTKKQRVVLAGTSSISETQILKFANMADLLRIKGIGQEYFELLEAAGVDTAPKLAQRKPENLILKLEIINAERNLTRRTPSIKEVENWISQAKELPRALENENLEKSLSSRFRGILNKEQGIKLNNHIKQMREEWKGI